MRRYRRSGLRAVARVAGLKQGRAETILAEVSEAVGGWGAFAAQSGVVEETAATIARSHRLALPRG